jgi:hypothetical protein
MFRTFVTARSRQTTPLANNPVPARKIKEMKYVIAAAILAFGYLFMLPAPAAHADGCDMWLTLGMQQQHDKCEASKNCSLGTQDDQIACCDTATFCTNPKKN